MSNRYVPYVKKGSRSRIQSAPEIRPPPHTDSPPHQCSPHTPFLTREIEMLDILLQTILHIYRPPRKALDTLHRQATKHAAQPGRLSPACIPLSKDNPSPGGGNQPGSPSQKTKLCGTGLRRKGKTAHSTTRSPPKAKMDQNFRSVFNQQEWKAARQPANQILSTPQELIHTPYALPALPVPKRLTGVF